MKQQLIQVQKHLKAAKYIALFWHRHPDGDCLGAMLGWGNFLKTQGKSIDYFVPTKPTENFDFFSEIKKIQVWFDGSQKYDILFFLDTATHSGQLGNIWIDNAQYFENHPNKIVIDHHISNTKYGDINIIKTSASSTCEIITEIIFKLTQDDTNKNIQNIIHKDIANDLLTWISTDTGHFKWATTHKTFSMVSWLLKQWGNLEYISNKLYRSDTLVQITFTQLLLSRIQKSWNIIFTRYTQQDRQEYGLENKFVEQALDIMTSIDHDGIFLFFKWWELDTPPVLRCSWRTKNTSINVAELASHFNGWGHRAAAGSQIEIKDNFQKTMQEVIKKANNLLNSH